MIVFKTSTDLGEARSFAPVVSGDFPLKLAQLPIHFADEILATGSRPAEPEHNVAFRPVVRHHQHFAKLEQPESRALDQIIGCFPSL